MNLDLNNGVIVEYKNGGCEDVKFENLERENLIEIIKFVVEKYSDCYEVVIEGEDREKLLEEKLEWKDLRIMGYEVGVKSLMDKVGGMKKELVELKEDFNDLYECYEEKGGVWVSKRESENE